MNLICEHVEYLVRHNDCVIIPGWGAFIAQYQPARINEENLFLPPSRSLGFNSALRHNDGLLASSISRRSGLSFDQAMGVIDNEVNIMRHQLEADGEVAIGKIGLFHKSAEWSMIFEPAPVDDEFFGLPSFSLESRSTSDEETKQPEREKLYLPISKNWLRIAASILVLLAIGFVCSTVTIPEIGTTQYASLSAPKVTKPEQSVKTQSLDESSAFLLAFGATDDSCARVDTTQRASYQAAVVRHKADVAAVEANADVRFDSSDPYYLIVASLPSMERAEMFISESGGGQLGIIEQDGNFRIYAATGVSAAQGLSPMKSSDFSRLYPQAWVCRHR